MTKQAFIHELKTALAQVNPNVQEEILADINEHFIEGAAQGISEEDICRSLGQPGVIAAQVLEEAGATPPPPPANSQEAYQYRKGSDMDETFTGVENVRAKLATCNLTLLPATDGVCRVVVQGLTAREECEVRNENGLLTITVKHIRSFFGFNFGRNSNTEVTVYLPAQFGGDIKVDASAGNIFAKGISGNLNLDTSAGNVTVNEHWGNRVRIDTSAGHVELTLANKYTDYVNIDTSAGNVTVRGDEIGRLIVDTSAGKVDVDVMKLKGDAKLDTSAGSVTLRAREVGGNVTLDTSAGSIHAYLPADINCRIEARKPSVGSLENQLRGNPQSPFRLKADTSVGSIHLRAL